MFLNIHLLTPTTGYNDFIQGGTDGNPYMTLGYTNGPGQYYHRDANGDRVNPEDVLDLLREYCYKSELSVKYGWVTVFMILFWNVLLIYVFNM